MPHLVIPTVFQAFPLPSRYGELDVSIAIVLGYLNPRHSKTVDFTYKCVCSIDLLTGHTLNLLFPLGPPNTRDTTALKEVSQQPYSDLWRVSNFSLSSKS